MICHNCKTELKRSPISETYICTNETECRMHELGYLEPSYFPQNDKELSKEFKK